MIFYLEDKTREELEKILIACKKAKTCMICEDVTKEIHARDLEACMPTSVSL